MAGTSQRDIQDSAHTTLGRHLIAAHSLAKSACACLWYSHGYTVAAITTSENVHISGGSSCEANVNDAQKIILIRVVNWSGFRLNASWIIDNGQVECCEVEASTISPTVGVNSYDHKLPMTIAIKQCIIAVYTTIPWWLLAWLTDHDELDALIMMNWML